MKTFKNQGRATLEPSAAAASDDANNDQMLDTTLLDAQTISKITLTQQEKELEVDDNDSPSSPPDCVILEGLKRTDDSESNSKKLERRKRELSYDDDEHDILYAEIDSS